MTKISFGNKGKKKEKDGDKKEKKKLLDSDSCNVNMDEIFATLEREINDLEIDEYGSLYGNPTVDWVSVLDLTTAQKIMSYGSLFSLLFIWLIDMTVTDFTFELFLFIGYLTVISHIGCKGARNRDFKYLIGFMILVFIQIVVQLFAFFTILYWIVLWVHKIMMMKEVEFQAMHERMGKIKDIQQWSWLFSGFLTVCLLGTLVTGIFSAIEIPKGLASMFRHTEEKVEAEYRMLVTLEESQRIQNEMDIQRMMVTGELGPEFKSTEQIAECVMANMEACGLA